MNRRDVTMKKTDDAIFETIKKWAGKGCSCVYLQPPCEEAALIRMQTDAKRHLGEEIPESYVQFLRLTNGAQFDGAFFKKGEDLVPENLDAPDARVIRLGNSGNVDDYVFDRRDRTFNVVSFGDPDSRFSSFPTFEGLLHDVLWQQQILPLEITIEGSKVEDLAGFAREFNAAFARGGVEGFRWKDNLDAFNDYLSWPTWKYRLIWKDAAISRKALGPALFDRFVEIIRDNEEYVELRLDLPSDA